MERREIEIFLTLAEELHFGRTAQRLFISQARVSQTIATLERRFGVALFDRTSRRVALTPVGAALHADVRAGYDRIQAGIAAAVAAGRGVTGTLTVGLEAPAVAELRPRLRLQRQRPEALQPHRAPDAPARAPPRRQRP
jgi:DNA-binding transcriptional LysR family regulator